jgi:uncharacterized membrane protein YeaQ/YmgE (transglycosylase-associated protein family)
VPRTCLLAGNQTRAVIAASTSAANGNACDKPQSLFLLRRVSSTGDLPDLRLASCERAAALQAVVASGGIALALSATMHLIVFLVFGLIVGALARVIVPGREPGGWIITMMLGVGGAIVGGYFGRVVGLYDEGQPAGFVMSLLAAISLVVVYQAISSRRTSTA